MPQSPATNNFLDNGMYKDFKILLRHIADHDFMNQGVWCLLLIYV